LENKKRNGIFRNVTTVLLLLLFQQSASAAGRFVANRFTYYRIDAYGIFAWVSVHHIVQMLLALIAIVILTKVLKLDFGFGFGDRKTGVEFVVNFTVAALVFALIWHLGAQLLGNVGMPNYPLNFNNIAGQLGFQLLLSGQSEEILFRALPITLLVCSFRESKVVCSFQENRVLRNEKLNISLENIIAALLFTLAHVNWSLNPFSVSASWVQLMLSISLGLWYGVAYQKSKSVIYPIAMHSIWNAVMVGARYIHLALPL